MSLSALDYAVIGGYLAAITAFGAWFARFQHSTRDYFLTDRSVPWWAVCFTIVATETSTLTFIGIPATSFGGNMTFLQLAAGYAIGRVLVSLLFVPAYFRGELFTSYELLRRRFGARVQTLSAAIFLGTRSLADGIRLFTTALVIAVVTGVPVPLVVVVLGAAMIFYTTRGGVAAVIWTDVVQMFVYVAGAAVIAWSLLSAIDGGWTAVLVAGRDAGRFEVFDLSMAPDRVYTVWSGLIGGITLTLATHGTDQFLVQRLLSARSAGDARAGLMLSGLLVVAQFALFLLIGVMLFTYYQQTPLPRPLDRVDEVLPTFVVGTLPPGIAGFIVAAIVAAALSPSLNAMAATTVADFYTPYVRPDASEATRMSVSRQATLAWGAVQVGVALGAQYMERPVLDAGLAVLSLGAGPVLGVFLLGTLSPSTRERDAFAGMIAGLLVVGLVWATTPVAWTWYAVIGAFTTGGVALAAGRRPSVGDAG